MPYIAQVAVGQRAHLNVFGDDYDTPDGTGQRDYIHVVDLARAHVAAVDYVANHSGARAFNIGTGQPYSVQQMVEAFRKASGHAIPVVIAPRRAGDIAAMQADSTRAHAELGWCATHTLDDMAASTWAWQSGNPHGFRGTYD
jgi:UDP-glucose 4-epimerase